MVPENKFTSPPMQSAIYLAGNKRQIFNSIAPHLNPDGSRTHLVDMFTGSGTVILNCAKNNLFKSYEGNDSLLQLIEMHKMLQNNANFNVLKTLNDVYPDSGEGYYRLRSDYNGAPSPQLLLLLQYRSNSNMMRWSKGTGFNIPYGKRERFDLTRIQNHHQYVKEEDVTFLSKDCLKYCNELGERDLSKTTVYADPPYIGTTAIYSDKWTWVKDDNLRAGLKKLALKGAKVVYSNTFSNRDFVNDGLIKWCDDNKDLFDVYHLDRDYSNSSFRKSDKKTDEVLIVSRD